MVVATLAVEWEELAETRRSGVCAFLCLALLTQALRIVTARSGFEMAFPGFAAQL